MLPERPEELEPERRLPESGTIFVGEKGKIMCETYSESPRLIPETRMQAYKRPKKTIPRVEGARHEQNWLDAIKGKTKPTSNFDYAGPFTETVLLGNVGDRVPGPEADVGRHEPEGHQLAEANEFVQHHYREGWSLGPRGGTEGGAEGGKGGGGALPAFCSLLQASERAATAPLPRQRDSVIHCPLPMAHRPSHRPLPTAHCPLPMPHYHLHERERLEEAVADRRVSAPGGGPGRRLLEHRGPRGPERRIPVVRPERVLQRADHGDFDRVRARPDQLVTSQRHGDDISPAGLPFTITLATLPYQRGSCNAVIAGRLRHANVPACTRHPRCRTEALLFQAPSVERPSGTTTKPLSAGSSAKSPST